MTSSQVVQVLRFPIVQPQRAAYIHADNKKKQEQPRVNFSFPSSPAPQGLLTMVLLLPGYSPILSVDSRSA